MTFWRGKGCREENIHKFGASDFRFNTDVFLVLEACRVTCYEQVYLVMIQNEVLLTSSEA
jgi:hypothetical protein